MASGKKSPVYRRQFLENYAKKKGFDPFIPENWYSQSRSEIRAEEV